MNNKVFNFFCVTAIITLFYIGFNVFESVNKYDIVLVLPVSFLIFICTLKYFDFVKTPVTLYSLVFFVWLRFVVMPFFITAATKKEIDYILLSDFSIHDATLFMVYELLFVGIVLFLLNKIKLDKYKRNFRKPSIILGGVKQVYMFAILFSIMIYLFYPGASSLINFFYIKIDSTGERTGDIVNSSDLLVRQVFFLALSLIFFLCLNLSKTKKINFYFSIIAGLIIVSAIVGERRTAQIYSAFSVIVLLISVYPTKIKSVISFILIPAASIILVMSIYKFLNVFLYDDYISALKDTDVGLNFAQLFQMYFFGPQNIAKSFDFAYAVNLGWSDLLYDFFRSIFGVSQLIKGESVITSIHFNRYVYDDILVQTGQVLSSSGYGAVYLGIAFAPIFTVLNCILSGTCEIVMKYAKTMEVKYLFSILTIRFSSNLFGPTPALINYATMMLGTFGLLFFISILLKNKFK